MQESEVLKKRKDQILSFFSNFKEDLGFLGLIILVFIGYKVRVSNLPLLKDISGGYIPGDPDAAAFLRYAKYVLENGQLMANDLMRYYPLGYNNLDEFNFLSHFIVYLYKFLHFFKSSITLEYVDVVFPAITFGIALIFFYLLVRKLFDFRIALLASAFLTFMPPFLYRTISGVGDKEALGIVFLFAAFYFYVLAVKSDHKYGYLHGITSGIFTCLLGLVWGGVNFVFLIIGGTVIAKIVTDHLEKKYFYTYALWWFTTFVLLNQFYNYYYGFRSILSATTVQLTVLALLSCFVYYLIKEKNVFNLKQKINLEKYPIGLLSFIGVCLVSLIFMVIIYKPIYIYDKILNVFIDLTRPFSRNRWALTVAESQQPYINSWFGNFGTYYIYLMLIGSSLVFYECFKNLKRHTWILTSVYTLFILSFIFSRYSSDTTYFNGTSTFSLSLYIGSLIFFLVFILGYFVYGFYKDKEVYEHFRKIDKTHIFILMWFLMTTIGARSAVRLLFIFVPVTTVLVSYTLIRAFDFGFYSKNNFLKIITTLIVGILIFAPFVQGSLIDRARITINTAKFTGPSYDQQWQMAMKFVRENTPKESVFAHWWDYGYWVQTFGERATLSDGGNARGAINHFTGRYLLTGRDRVEALELLKTHKATHFLAVSDEIGKYTAFSSIGADENYDRYSYIPTFFMNPAEITEGRDEEGKATNAYLFRGNFVLDEDFMYNGKLFPDSNALVGGVILTFRESEGTTDLRQPVAVMFYQNERTDVPLNCVYINNQEIQFGAEGGYQGCLVIYPVVGEDGSVNPFGAGLLLSPNTRQTVFSQLYLLNKDGKTDKAWEGFEKVYDDSAQGYGLAYYVRYGRLIGPLKIWELSYGSDIKENPIYLGTELPNPDVERV